ATLFAYQTHCALPHFRGKFACLLVHGSILSRIRASTKSGAVQFVERVWRSIKYEEIYLRAYESVSHARRSIGDYIELYNRKRPHSSLADQTPDEAYFATLPAIKSAA
ncbi:integrase core domain-containing protein, partial [Burkholderia anthina]|uniref:integrase core domain-containing protein n=1 Tax=Burkholderia anthina TaxID=179879 RepID=UPI001CF1DEFB